MVAPRVCRRGIATSPREESYLGLEKTSCIMEIVSIQSGARELAR